MPPRRPPPPPPPPPRCWRPQIPRTELANIYGHPLEPEIQGIIPLKSALTPVTLKPHPTDRERKFADDVRWLQRRSYGNFTAAELERLDALAPLYNIHEDETAINPNADITIHPVMQRNKWNYPMPKHLAEFPLGGDLDGYWNPCTDDIAWEAILPSIRIASLYISHADLWPWVDGLLAAEWTDIPQSEAPHALLGRHGGWKRFNTRDPLVYGTEEGRRNVRNKILSYSKNIYFRLTSSFADAASGVQAVDYQMGSVAGQTLTSKISNDSVIVVGFYALAPLLPGSVEKLNTAERRLVEGEVAKTIIHELGHALFQQAYRACLPSHNGTEIYFHEEVISEIYGTRTLKYKKVTGQDNHLKENGMRFTLSRDPFTEFEGIPNNNQHTGLRSDSSDTPEPPRKRQRIPTAPAAVVRRAHTFQGPPRHIQEIKPQIDTVSEFKDQDLPPCPRFDEISAYLIDNRCQLALHTMCFAMPEHTLRDYILRLGELKISAQEWRAYLLHCEAAPYLFRFEAHGRCRDTSTYRGSIQLHASSWPKTDLPPIKILDIEDKPFMKKLTKGMRLCTVIDILARYCEHYLDQMWLHSIFWDVDMETFLTMFNSDIKQGNGIATKIGLGLMSIEELEDLVQTVVSVGTLLTWAPKGIIRRLPLTITEFKEVIGGKSSLRGIILPKGRSLIDWDAGYEALRRWDDEVMETDLDKLARADRGITYADGQHESEREYSARTESPPVKTQAELEEEESERQTNALDDSIVTYREAHPDATAEELFEKSYWDMWKGFNPEGTRKVAQEEFDDCLEYLKAMEEAGAGGFDMDILKNAMEAGGNCPNM
ncbi:hypothetical protein BcDW1_10856 [Botrytis cinerea BcDW1]|uniref:Uncharacterized protein n=1 Tax=Botryotinia fuckeliana (strain BcDW1) TaxID=1290391 RepID=M7TAR3_BOTF1|nr:hypothetical protein BcDW1_10856 [Botrytis cinerea BcDW1]